MLLYISLTGRREYLMLKFIKKVTKKAGAAPGTLVHIGERKTDRVHITLVDYLPDQLREQECETIEEAFPLMNSPTSTWLNIDGIHDIELIEKIGTHFNIHPLILEDIVNTGHRPKVEEFENYIYFVLKMLYLNEETSEVRSEQVSLLLGNRFIISFQEAPGNVFEPVRERIRKGVFAKRASTIWPMHLSMPWWIIILPYWKKSGPS